MAVFISHMVVENYRTFRHVEFSFDDWVNYIVGDNNIGKSNFLTLLKDMTHGFGFRENDFLDPDEPIRIEMILSSSDNGLDETLHLELSQHIREVVPRLYNKDDGKELPLEYVRCLFYMDFKLDEVPRNMLSEGEMMKTLSIIENYMAAPDHVKEVETLLNERGFHLDLPDNDSHKAALLLMSEIFQSFTVGSSYDSTMKLMIAVGISLLIKMLKKKESRAISFENMVVTDRKGKRYLPVTVSIDEPELHLHPYLQRAMLAFCRSILGNEEPFFLKMVKTMLGVDGLNGQLFVVTHSTDALVNDYRQIIRIYWDDKKKVQAACGASFHFDREIEKHLIMHFPEVKEALYSKCTILVEGETEYGSFGYFARTLGVNFDYHGICLINARGESSISKIAQLVRRFHIPAVCLYDRDVISGKNHSPYVFFTDYICYEMDVVKACLSARSRQILDAVIGDVEDAGDAVNTSLIKKAGAKLGLPRGYYPPAKLKNINPRNQDALEFYYFAWLYGNKGVIIGRALGERLTKKEIPKAFARVIETAVRLSCGESISCPAIEKIKNP